MKTKGMLYYTSNNCDKTIMQTVINNLQVISDKLSMPIVSVSLAPVELGYNIVLPLERSPLTMYKQQLKGLQTIETDIVFFVEHDVIYPLCHFDCMPPSDDIFYYNINWWKVRSIDGQVATWKAIQVSGLCADRQLLIEHYQERIKRTERRYSRRVGFEPGLHKYPRGIDMHDFQTWESRIPYVDIVHGNNISKSRFIPDPRLENYALSDNIPFWGKSKNQFWEFLESTKMKEGS